MPDTAEHPPRLLDPRWRPIVIGMVAVITLAAFEGVGTTTAMPVVARELDAVGSYTWAFTAYVLASLLAMVVAGLHCDAHGPRTSVITGISAFAVGGIVAGFAWNLPSLVIGRSLQGVGSGMVIVGIYVVIARAFPIEIRPKAFSVLSAAWVIPALTGPLIAGWLADEISWRWVFWLVPFFVLPPALLLVPRLAALSGGSPVGDRSARLRAGVLVCFGLVLVQDGVLRLNPVGLIEALAGIVLITLACPPLFPPGARRLARGLATTVMMRGLIASAYFSAEVFIPLALVRERGVTTTMAGLALALSAVGWSMGSLVQSRLPGDTNRAPVVRIGALIVAASILSTSVVLVPGVPVWVATVTWAVGAVGMGLCFPSIAVQALRLSPEADQGRTSSALQIADSLLVVVVTAVIGSVHALAVRGGTDGPGTYLTLWAAAAGIALLAAATASRMAPRPA